MKKRLMAFLLVFVMAMGMMPTAAFAAETTVAEPEITATVETVSSQTVAVEAVADFTGLSLVTLYSSDGGSTGTNTGVVKDEGVRYNSKDEGWWGYSHFLRFSLIRVSGSENLAGIQTADNMITQDLLNEYLKSASYEKFILDIVDDSRMLGNAARFARSGNLYITNNTAFDYRVDNFDKTYVKLTSSNVQPSNAIVVNDNHVIMGDTWFQFDITPTVGEGMGYDWENITEAMINYRGSYETDEQEKMAEFVSGRRTEPIDVEGVADLTNNYFSIFKKFEVLFDNYEIPNLGTTLWSAILNDAASEFEFDKNSDDYCYTGAAFYSPDATDDYAYFLFVEPGAFRPFVYVDKEKVGNDEEGPIYDITYTYGSYAFTTVRDGVYGNSGGFAMAGMNAKFSPSKIDTIFSTNMQFNNRGPVIVDENLQPIYTSETANAYWDVVGSAYSDPNSVPTSKNSIGDKHVTELGIGMLMAYGRKGVGMSTDTSISISKSYLSNFPDSYFTDVFGESLESVKFPVTIKIDGFSRTGDISLWDSSGGEDAGGIKLSTASISGGSCTFNLMLGLNETVYIRSGFGDINEALGENGILEDEASSLSITISEDLSSGGTNGAEGIENYADAGMVGFIYEGSKPYGYSDVNNASSMPYGSSAKYDAMVASHTGINATDGFAMSDTTGVVTATISDLSKHTRFSIQNVWTGYEVEKTIGGSDTGTYTQTRWDEVVAANSGLAFFEQFKDVDRMYQFTSLFIGIVPDVLGWCSSYPDGAWACAAPSTELKMITKNNTGSISGVFGVDDLGNTIVVPNVDVYVKPFVQQDSKVLILDPIFSVHTFIATTCCDSYNMFSAGEVASQGLWLAAENGGTDELEGDTFYATKVTPTYKSGSAPDIETQRLDSETCDTRASTWMAADYEEWKTRMEASDAKGLDDKSPYVIYGDFPIDINDNRHKGEATVAYAANITNLFSTDTKNDGTCHVIVDLNMNGQALYEVENVTGGVTQITTSEQLIDCGTFNDGDEIDFAGTVLKPYSFTVTTSSGISIPITATPKGIYDAAVGGTDYWKSGKKYLLENPSGKEEHEHVLFVQWEFSTSYNPDKPGDPGDPGNPPGTPTNPSSSTLLDSGWHTVYWDYGYTGGGVTSTQMGVTVNYATDKLKEIGTITCNCKTANAYAVDIHVEEWTSYLTTYELDVPARPERQGWVFLGWVNEGTTQEPQNQAKYPTKYAELYSTDYAYINKIDRIMRAGGQGATIQGALDKSPAKEPFGYINFMYCPYDTQMKDYLYMNEWIQAAIDSDGAQADLDKIEGTTFRAMWASQYVCWHSMGGTFVNRSDDGTDQVKQAGCWWEAGTTDEPGNFHSTGVTNHDDHKGCGNWGHAASWCGEHTNARLPGTENHVNDCETYVSNSMFTSETEFVAIASAPVREGYTFMGWFFDPYCSVPLTEFEIGIQPGRHYYAGWEAEDVVIEYYDTREGTSFIGSQTVSYGDQVSLMPAVNGTSGWQSVGWSFEPDNLGTEANELVNDSAKHWYANPGRAYDEMETINDDNLFFLEYCLEKGNATYYPANGTGYDDPADTGTWENEGHWVVRFYADYTIDTTSYTVKIHWDDFANNDGCRPEAVHVGLISSLGNVLYSDAWVTGGSTADTWTHTFDDLPITVSDANTDVINYSFCVLGYRDANGNEAVVKDTQASHGEMFMTTPTDHSTDANTLYRYDINLYDVGGNGSEHLYSSNERGLNTLSSSNGYNGGVANTPNGSIVYTPYEGVLYMTHDLILTGDDIIFTIEWDDDSNRDGMRPEYVMLYLWAKDGNGGFTKISMDTLAGNYENGTVAITEGMCDVSEDGNTWVYTFEDYQKYTNEGQLIIYGFTVGAGSVPNYNINYMEAGNGPDTNGVTLQYAPKMSAIPFDINWHDNDNQDGLRPSSVTVELVAYQWNAAAGEYEYMTVDTQIVKGNSTASTWTGRFAETYVYHDGMPVTYRMKVSSDLNGNIDDDSNGYTWTEGIVGNYALDGARPSVDIYHNADEKSVTATVQWDDNLNNDQFRPDSVVLQLYADGVEVKGEDYRVNLTGDPTALTWTHTFEHLDIYEYGDSGDEITYTVRVTSARGGELADYTAYYINENDNFVTSANASTEPFVLLDYTPKTDLVKGVIYWQDESNRDGERAEFVDVKLMADVYDEGTNSWITYVAESMTVNGATDARNTMTADEWYFEFPDMPIYRDTYPITYYLVVDSDLNGNISETAKNYSWEEKTRGNMHDTDDLEVSVTVYQRLEVLNITATVEWNDDNNNDNLRPNAIVLQLFADNVRVEGEAYTVTLYGEPTVDTWTHTFENLPRYEEGDSGDEITYTIYAAELTEGSLYGTYEDTAITGEVYTFPKYVASYKTINDGQYSEDLTESVEAYVKLTHPNNEMDVPISIIWQDENNRDGQRPEYVSVRLMAYQWNEGLATWEYKEVATKTIKYDDVNHMTASEWTDTFGYHEMYHDGVKIIYHLQVMSNLNEFIPEGSFEYGWVESAYGNQTEAIPQVIIQQNTNTTVVPATIYWDDSQNNDNIRPTNIIVQLYSHVMGETPEPVPGIAYRVNLSGDPMADNWYYTFSGMPRFAEGHSGVELIYTIQVIEADGEPLYGYYIIDANGEEEEVLRYEASYLYEDPPTNTTINTLDPNESDRAYVRLEHITETKTMNFSINWHDGDNRDNVRPDNVKVDLYKTIGNGEPIYLRTLDITENQYGTWTYKVTGLDGYEDGQPVKYTIEVPQDMKDELAAGGYTTTTQDNILHMYYTPNTGSISTKLYWVDDEDNDGYRVDSVIATLYANGVSTGKTIDLNATNDWSGTWTDLDVHYIDGTATGTDVIYNVVVEAPNGYTVSYNPESTTIEENEVLYIQLTHEADVADVPVTVYWNDNSDNDGKRPEQIKVMLLVDGEESYYTTVMDANNAITGSSNIWTYTFENLPVYRGDGEKIYYSVIIYDDATWEGEYDSLTTGTTMYMSHDMAMSTMYVSFQFNDNNNADGERPTGLYLQLTADGIPVDDSEYKHTVSFDTNVDGYSWNFGNLPVYKTDGTKILYNVNVAFDEALGATDYSIWKSSDIELSESGDAAVNQIIVRLSKEANTTTHTGYIYWFDCNNIFGNRPDSLTLSLHNNHSDTSVPYVVNAATGEVTNRATGKVVGTVTVEEWTGDASLWTYTISDLAENYINNVGQSAPVYYWVKANTTSIAQYYPTVFTGEDYGMDVALTHRFYEEYADTAAQDFTLNLMWLDNSNDWGYRPESNGVKVNLMANGELYDTKYLTSADAVNGNGNAWSYTWKDLPTYRDGAGIVWTVEAADVDKYTQEVTITSADDTTVTYFQSVGFNFRVNWNDSDNDDAVRPANVVLNVFADGEKVGSVTMSGSENVWIGSISDLAVWRESDGDAAIQYTFKWDDATAKYLAETGYLAGPTKDGVEVSASHFYYLSVAQFGDNSDAGYDVLSGTYDWETTLSYNKEIADYYFDVTFVDDVDRDGFRPDELSVNLLADGKVINTKVLTVNQTDSVYTLIWEDLEVWESGKAINYTIDIAEVPAEYVVSYNELHTDATLTHDVVLVDVTGTVNWDDSTELVDVLNPEGTYVRSYEQIARTDVYVQLYADGEKLGEPVLVTADTYGTGENLLKAASTTWTDLYKYRHNGIEIEYTIEVYSDGLTALLDDGHSLAYDFDTQYAPEATVTHDLYDIRGSVYYMYTYSTDFLLKNVPVTAYLQDVATGEYHAVASTITDDNGEFEFLNLEQGLYIIRATYVYGENTLAGTAGVELDRKDNNDNIVLVNRTAVNDSDYYNYTATGTAYYQTDITDDSTIVPVPKDSVVLLYKVVDGKEVPEYVGMTQTDANGRYAFGGLQTAEYIVNVVFNYEGGVYTYDNADALADDLRFVVAGADVQWPDIIKQVNDDVDVNDPVITPDEPEKPEDKPIPCIVNGYVFYADNGVHSTDPIEGVDVYVYTSGSNIEVGKDTTDENGFWEVEGLPAGDYVAVFSYQGNASRVLMFTISESDYETGTYEAAPQYFDRLVEVPTGTIKGIVLDEKGNSMRALVAIYNDLGELQDFMYTDTYGFYEFTVTAGYDYNVRILAVEDEITRLPAGDPDDDLTTLDYYVLSGIFGIDGVPQDNKLVAVYHERNGEYELVTATLTDANGKFNVKVYDEGNYRVCPYINGDIFEVRDVSVGYQEERPQVTTAINGTYTVTGVENYNDLTLYKIEKNSVEHLIKSETGKNASSYKLLNLDAGTYRLQLVDVNGNETWYYFTCPDGALVDVTYYMTISGKVVDENGKAIIGATVGVYDANGKLVAPETIILSDGEYSYSGLVEGEYMVVITSPNTSEVLADRWTYQEDSYGTVYPTGMESEGVWVWNINAKLVEGSVTDQNGVPYEGAWVQFNDPFNPERSYMAITDENGNYKIGLGAGDYLVNAVYYWDTNHFYKGVGTGAMTLVNDVRGVDFVINRYALTVETVRSADGVVAPNADVTIHYVDGTLYWMGETDENGQVTVDVFPGQYLVSAEYDGIEAVKTTEYVGQDMTVRLELDSVVYITGTVTDADGQPVSDGLVYYDNGNGFRGYVYTDDDGKYVIPVNRIDMGEFTLYATSGNDVGESIVITVDGDEVANLVVNKTEATYTITGVVTDEDGNRLENALVTMTWGNDKVNNTTTSTNSLGEYTFEVEDGTYYLTATYEAPNGYDYVTNAEYAVHVNGADVEQNLMVRMRYNVNVTVIDWNGDPVEATVVYDGAETGEAVTDENGQVTLYLANGSYRFFAETESRTSRVKTVVVNGETDVVLELTNVGIQYEEPVVTANELNIWGYVYNPDGYPVNGAEVKLYKQDLETLEWNLVDTKATDMEGYYIFEALTEGTYRVDTVYDYTTEAVVNNDGFIIDGYLTDEHGNPLANNVVELYHNANLITTVTTGEDGYYKFVDVDGELTYTVHAEDATGEEVLVETLSPVGTDLTIEDTVVDIAGNIVVGALVVITDENGETVTTTVTDETGYYKVVVDGQSDTYNVTVTYLASYEVDTPTYVRNTTDRNAPYLTDSWYTIEGYVHDDDGNLVEGAIVVLKDESKTEINRYTTAADGYYIFDNLEDGIYYVEIIFKGETEHIYEVETGTGDVTDVTPEPEPEESRGIDVIITNYSDADVIEPAAGWVEGENEFRVDSDVVLKVYLKDEFGYLTELRCYEDAGEQVFTGTFYDGDEIILMVCGDADLDGIVTVTDMTRISQYLVGLYPFNEYQKLAADGDRDGLITVTDMTRISQSLVSLYQFVWFERS